MYRTYRMYRVYSVYVYNAQYVQECSDLPPLRCRTLGRTLLDPVIERKVERMQTVIELARVIRAQQNIALKVFLAVILLLKVAWVFNLRPPRF